MPFKDVIEFLFTESIGKKDDRGNTIRTQQDFAKHIGIKRETLISWIEGHHVPMLSTIKDVIEGQGYDFNDCLAVPVAKRQKAYTEHAPLFQHLEDLILTGDKDRIHGIKVNLDDIATRAKEEKKRLARKNAQKDGNIAHRKKPKAANEAG